MAKKSLETPEIFLFIFHFLKKKTRRVAKIRQPKKKKKHCLERIGNGKRI